MEQLLGIMQKEWWEIKRAKRSLVLLVVVTIIPSLVFMMDNSSALIDREICVYLYPLALAFAANMQILLYSIINEQKDKTMEILLALPVKRSMLILGKVIPSTIVALLFYLLTIGEMMVVFHLQGESGIFSISMLVLVEAALAAYTGANMCVLTGLLVHDERSVLSTFMLVSLGYFLLLFLLSLIAQPQTILYSLGLMVLAVVLTMLNSYVLEKRVAWIIGG